ncbi:ABC transporter ATP-binding protein [Bacillus sp. B1-b2]|uniref:ABC transporter ATP-binding protein n=1 Tax=Bacillus sp. B1-b2 TaxID=2653201 RepID=UPI0012615B96|nr:ABC transporter transmembrane domain-containing protein [Bacillus sp. B1-b2]KAB7663584.1 ATP-binding cassette domain-containing protein [Bacillus sp. B1-b2]
MKVFLDLKWYFLQEKKAYFGGILLLLFVAFIQLIPPRIVGVVVDHIQSNTLTGPILLKWMVVLIISGFMLYVLRYYWRIMIFGSAVKLGRLMRNRLYDHFTRMSQSFYQKKRIGDLMAHATNDVQAIQQTAGQGVLTFVDSLATGGSVIIAMATLISWKLTLICLLPLPLMAILTSWYGSLIHKHFHKAQAAFSDLNDKTQESVTGIKVLKTFGQDKEDIEDFRKSSLDVVEKNIKVAKVDALFDPTITIIVSISFFLAIIFGSRYVISGDLTLGELVSFTTYLGLLVWPMLAFGWLFNIVERGRASYDRVTALLQTKVDIVNDVNAIKVPPCGDIEYRLDSYSYNQQVEVLQNIHFQLKRGQTLGIVGKTGAGKTTLLKLLFREYDQYIGEISINHQNIKRVNIEALRSSIGYVPQEHFLFSASIRENITFANPQAKEEDIYQAAKLADIHEDIMSFTNGYDTIVGERGVSLSGGQKQRISIARALLMDPEILILDDSLSAVDAKTEETILNALRGVRQEKTTIITAHRLSAIEHAELILVLEEGKIIQSGNHEKLMRENGWYKEMYHRQALEVMVSMGDTNG